MDSLRNYPTTCLEGTITMKELTASHCPDQESNPAPSKYESGVPNI
jgi:hypothetical protein